MHGMGIIIQAYDLIHHHQTIPHILRPNLHLLMLTYHLQKLQILLFIRRIRFDPPPYIRTVTTLPNCLTNTVYSHSDMPP